MPGSVSDSYDPEFGTGENARDVRDAIEKCRDRLTKSIGTGELKNIIEVVHGSAGPRKPGIRFTERELRVMRFALNRALESI